MEQELKDIVATSLRKAREHERTGNAGKAYAYYTVVAELCPAKRPEIEEPFADVLCQWGIQLAFSKRFKDVQLCYERSLDLYPRNARMLNNYAAHLLRNNNPMEAMRYLKSAVEASPNFLPAQRNLQNALSMVVDRWHFPMLNDKKRNNAFDHAIQKRISQGYDTVLDIGTGTGLLSLYAKDAGAKEVYACECSDIMAKVAESVFADNNAKSIKLFSKYSSDLRIPEDIPKRLKLIVTETFDAGLFGELVVPSMINAHTNILHPNGIIIPAAATLYVAAVECEFIRYRSSVIFTKVTESSALNFDHVSVLPDDEFYDTETMQNVKSNYVTEPQVLLTMNFNDLAELHEFSKDGIKSMISVKCRYDGTIDGVVTWFKLHLDDEITIDSSEEESCWQFAVFPTLPYPCRQGEILSVVAEISRTKLKCSYLSNRSDLSHDNEQGFLYRLPKEVIVFLNDFEYVKLLRNVVETLKEKDIKTVLDTAPFPIYGLMLLKENVHVEILYCKTDNLALRQFIEKVVENNSIRKKICFIESYNEIKCELDSIYFHAFDMKGELKDNVESENYDFFRRLLKPDGILVPEQIFLMGQLVYSSELSRMCYVKDSNLQRISTYTSSISSSEKNSDDDDTFDTNIISNYKVAKHINQFKIDQVLDLNSSLYLYETLSDKQILVEVTQTDTSETIVNFGRLTVARSKHLPNALICWYKIMLTTDYIYHTRRNGSFMNYMAFLLGDKLSHRVSQSEEIHLKVFQSNGLVNVNVI